MLPDNVAISNSVQVYLDLGYNPEVAINKAARADHLSRRRPTPPDLKGILERAQIAADSSRWASQRYGTDG
ncbi:MAG: hypothetical protein ACAF41_20100 [Leptolyngbya sp. BL-A-14]